MTKTYAFELSGEHETLPKSEALALVEANSTRYSEIDSLEQCLIVEADDLDVETLGRRLAMTHRIIEVLGSLKPTLRGSPRQQCIWIFRTRDIWSGPGASETALLQQIQWNVRLDGRYFKEDIMQTCQIRRWCSGRSSHQERLSSAWKLLGPTEAPLRGAGLTSNHSSIQVCSCRAWLAP